MRGENRLSPQAGQTTSLLILSPDDFYFRLLLGQLRKIINKNACTLNENYLNNIKSNQQVSVIRQPRDLFLQTPEKRNILLES